MTWTDFWIVFASCALTMLACRVIPLFALKGKPLSELAQRALGFIPPAAFAALVANDLFAPGMFAEGLWPAAGPLIAAAGVVLVAVKTKSLIGCAATGCALYALLMLF